MNLQTKYMEHCKEMFDFISQRDAEILQIVIEDVPHQYQDRLLAELSPDKEK